MTLVDDAVRAHWGALSEWARTGMRILRIQLPNMSDAVLWHEYDAIGRRLSHAPVIAVSSEMGALVEGAAESLPPDTLLHPEDVWSDTGFAWFQTPIAGYLLLDHGEPPRPTRYCGMYWQKGVAANDGHPLVWVMLLQMTTDVQTAMGDSWPSDDDARAGQLMWAETYPWLIGDSTSKGLNVDGGDSRLSTRDRASMWSLWHLMGSTIATTSSRSPSRPVRRRASTSRPVSDVTVVTLRRHPHEPSDGPTDVEWSHRWVVSGHWRNQWYPSTEMHRPIWVSPYVKGPEGLPLVVKSRRVKLVR